MDRPRLQVDFNEMLGPDLVLLSQGDTRIDSDGNEVELHEGMRVYVWMGDVDATGNPDNLIAAGTVERNVAGGWSAAAKWCCRIDAAGIQHESDRVDGERGSRTERRVGSHMTSDRQRADREGERRLLDAFEKFSMTGTASVTCDRCGRLIYFEKLATEAWKVSCSCGRYNDTLRGL